MGQLHHSTALVSLFHGALMMTTWRVMLRLSGLATVVATGLILAFVLVVPPDTRAALIPVLYVSIALVTWGLALMIVHINVTHVVAETQKSAWRAALWWGGPLVAGWYLWQVGAGAPARNNRRSFDQLTVPQRIPYRGLPTPANSRQIVVVLVVVSLTFAIAWFAPDRWLELPRVRASESDSFFVFIRRMLVSGIVQVIGSVIGCAVMTPLFQDRLWPWAVVALSPSWALIMWRQGTQIEAAIMIGAANVFLAWLAGRAARSYFLWRRSPTGLA